METYSEINVFTIDPHGYKTHWRITKDTSKEELTNLINRQVQLSGWLAEKGYTPDDFGRGGATFTPAAAPYSPAPPAAEAGAVQQQGGIPPAQGGGAVWLRNPDGTKACSLHGVAAFQAPGVSKRTGQPYTGFWKCTVRGCRPEGEN